MNLGKFQDRREQRKFQQSWHDASDKCAFIQGLPQELLGRIMIRAPKSITANVRDHASLCFNGCFMTLHNAECKWLENHPTDGASEAETQQLHDTIKACVDQLKT